MSNLYLKNMDKALEFLDLAEEKGIEKECVCSVSDRTIAISNLKMLRPMVKAYGYGANEQYREVVSSLMKNRKTVEVIMICPLSSRQVKYLKVSDKNTYISFWSVGIFMHTISLYIF